MDAASTFNCNGRVNSSDCQLSKENLFANADLENELYPLEQGALSSVKVDLFDRELPLMSTLLELKHFVKCIEMQLRILSRYEQQSQSFNSETREIDFYHIRHIVCRFLACIRIYLNSIKWNIENFKLMKSNIEEDFNFLFITMKRFLKRLREIPFSTFQFAPSNAGNKSTKPEFHLYHAHLEVRWHLVLLTYSRSISLEYSGEIEPEQVDSVLGSVIKDLAYISLMIFDRTLLIDVRTKSPFNCTCIRELWLMLQIFIDTLSQRINSKSFWDYVNDCINEVVKNTVASSKSSASQPTEEALPFCRNSELFSVWLLYHLSLLYGYSIDGIYLESKCSRIRPSDEHFEKVLKKYVGKAGKAGERDGIDEELSIMIPMIAQLIIKWWKPKTSIISLLWDCFHKRLDVPFLLQTSGPWTISLDKKSAADILKQVRDRIGSLENISESSYSTFLRLLGTFLKKHYHMSDMKYWNQIKGRIYSKFSKSKVQEFSASGLYNFISLFLTLAVTTDTISVCSVMLDLLPSIKEFDPGNSKKHCLIWKGRLAVLLLYNDLHLNLESISDPFIETVNAISCRKDEAARAMMTNFVDVFSLILSCSKYLDLGEHLFLGGWVDRYLLECSKRMSATLIKVLLNIFEKCIELNTSSPKLEGVSKMLDGLWCYVACRVRQLVFDPVFTSEHYRDLSQLAVLFTLEAVRNPILAKKHKHSAISLFNHFASSMIIKDVRITRAFLSLILSKEESIRNFKKEIKNFDIIIIQSWIKCSILGRDENQKEIEPLKNYIVQLDEIKQILSAPEDLNEFRNSAESILIFIMCSMKRRTTLQTKQEELQFDSRWKQYFNHIEKWILVPINDDTKETELAFWIYRCIGTLILCTAQMLYIKNQTPNLLRTLLNKVVLLPENSPQLYIKTLGKKIFSMIILGIETLNVKGDISLQALVRDLFDQYMPVLIIPVKDTSNNLIVSDALLKCFRDAKTEFVRFIIEMLMSNFFTMSIDNTMHKKSYLVTVLLQNLLKAHKNYASTITEYIVTICSPCVFWCYLKVHDHHPHKQHTVEFINNVVSNSHYKQVNIIREKFYNAISGVILKSLTVYQQRSFELLRSISKVEMGIIVKLTPEIENIIKDLERYRRPNAASLRYSWAQLQSSMKNGAKAV